MVLMISTLHKWQSVLLRLEAVPVYVLCINAQRNKCHHLQLQVRLSPGLDPGRRDAYGTIVASVHTKYHGAVHLQAADT